MVEIEIEVPPPCDEEDDAHRDVYAYFGLAYFLSECVHRGLANGFVLLSSAPGVTTRPRVEERFAQCEVMTMGELVGLVKPLLPASLHESVDWALERRNYLAHRFWYERVHEQMDPIGRQRLVAYLADTRDQMRALSRALDEIALERYAALGISRERFDEVCKAQAKTAPPATIARRIPKVEERLAITHAWLASDGESGAHLVLVDDAGELWQLGERGLDWSLVAGPTQSWKPYRALQRHLPAAIVARPRNAALWNYKLHLSSGALLTVERPADGPMRFGVSLVGFTPSASRSASRG